MFNLYSAHEGKRWVAMRPGNVPNSADEAEAGGGESDGRKTLKNGGREAALPQAQNGCGCAKVNPSGTRGDLSQNGYRLGSPFWLASMLILALGATTWSVTCRGLRAPVVSREHAPAGVFQGSSHGRHGRPIFVRLGEPRILPAIPCVAATSSAESQCIILPILESADRPTSLPTPAAKHTTKIVAGLAP